MGIASPWRPRVMEKQFIHVASLRTLYSTVGTTIPFFGGEFFSDFDLDTFSNLIALNESLSTYIFNQQGIAWPGESKKYTSAPNYPLDQIAPPPNWGSRFPNGYTNATPPPDLRIDEHFQNWMRTAGLPTFSKLWGRNDSEALKRGTYSITVDLSRCIMIIEMDITHWLLG